MFAYFQRIREILSQVEELESTSLAQAVEILSDAIKKKQAIFIFGASHAGILAEEMFYRAGGLVSINPIFGRELMLDTRPISATSRMERLVGYSQLLAKKTPFKTGNLLGCFAASKPSRFSNSCHINDVMLYNNNLFEI